MPTRTHTHTRTNTIPSTTWPRVANTNSTRNASRSVSLPSLQFDINLLPVTHTAYPFQRVRNPFQPDADRLTSQNLPPSWPRETSVSLSPLDSVLWSLATHACPTPPPDSPTHSDSDRSPADPSQAMKFSQPSREGRSARTWPNLSQTSSRTPRQAERVGCTFAKGYSQKQWAADIRRQMQGAHQATACGHLHVLGPLQQTRSVWSHLLRLLQLRLELRLELEQAEQVARTPTPAISTGQPKPSRLARPRRGRLPLTTTRST